MGNRPGTRLIGLIYPMTRTARIGRRRRIRARGLLKDDDARDWNADDLLET